MGGTSFLPIDDIIQEDKMIAFHVEVVDLRCIMFEALEHNYHMHGLVFELLQCFEFVELACKYHCAAKDKVIFLVLDVHLHNVAHTYTLEHKDINGLFDLIFNRLNVILMEEIDNDQNNGISLKSFQELVFCIGTIQTFISKHMFNEENRNYI
ncbi:hypothetical protein PanWU01x14_166050 [Parasponia andersonii]|uniref:Uncharacterized protein n=1 Tax=Parasponia andersonii TaxID=3476 RepID=A0A2P5CC57_PARAD|nr:hypothetical protein PanWU01x14_166050 [Parasponia andersonii]